MYYIPAPPPRLIFIPGPVGVYGVAGYVETLPTYEESQAGGKGGAFKAEIKFTPPPPPSPIKKREEEKKKKSDAKKKDQAPKSNFYAPAPQHPGTNYMFPLETTKIHIFNKGAKVWEPKYKGVQL